jgi:hypothetical protein
VKPSEPDETKNVVDTARPAPERHPPLSEDEKKQLELGGRMEHEHGTRREKLEEKIEKIDEGK